MNILSQYICHRFLKLFFYCLLCVFLMVLIVDLVEMLDKFIDKEVPRKIIFLYYFYYAPLIVVMALPVSVLLATVFTIGSFAQKNEMAAMKALGYSLYQVMGSLLTVGFFISVLSFFLAEGVVAQATKKKEDIRREYMEKTPGQISSRLRNLEIQESPDTIITIGYYDSEKAIAYKIKVETYREHRLVSRLDTPSMRWDGAVWIVEEGYQRFFNGETETAVPIRDTLSFRFQFDPKELQAAQISQDEMGFKDLLRFIRRIDRSGGGIHGLLTDLHFKIAFPVSSFIIVLFSVPIAYNRRKKSLAVGFGISLVVCFFYFGLVKIGQTFGQKGILPPILSAWLGNGIMGVCSVFNVMRTRK